MSQPPCLDNPQTTAARQLLLRRRGYLRSLYENWYQQIIACLPDLAGQTLELGSGGGFLAEWIPGLRTSDVMSIPGVELTIDARALPFETRSLRAIVGTNVLHHVPDIEQFLAEAQRVLVDRGRLVFIEPWPTPLSRWVYAHLHHEPFDIERDWSIPEGGPLTAANGALPWIVFTRDRARLGREFPHLAVVRTRPLMPFAYLFGGGIGRAWPLPSVLFRIVRTLEAPLDRLGLFALIVIERVPRT
jgi:SAM-dependent methyltransferase